MSNLGENNNETANGNQEEYEYDPDFIEETENLDPDLVLEAQDSFDQESGRYPAYLCEQDPRSADEYEEDVPYQQYADSRTQFDEQKVDWNLESGVVTKVYGYSGTDPKG